MDDCGVRFRWRNMVQLCVACVAALRFFFICKVKLNQLWVDLTDGEKIDMKIFNKLNFVICTLLFFCGSAHAESLQEKDSVQYPSIQELKNDCTQAVALANDSRAFMSTKCAKMMYGLWNGLVYLGTISQSNSIANTAENKAADDLLKDRIAKNFCFNMNQSGPAELALARDFVAYVEKLEKEKSQLSSKAILDSSGPITLAGFLKNNYACSEGK